MKFLDLSCLYLSMTHFQNYISSTMLYFQFQLSFLQFEPKNNEQDQKIALEIKLFHSINQIFKMDNIAFIRREDFFTLKVLRMQFVFFVSCNFDSRTLFTYFGLVHHFSNPNGLQTRGEFLTHFWLTQKFHNLCNSDM